MKTIILGTAHLKSTPGKCSPDKRLKEYEYSRKLVKAIKEKLEDKGFRVFIDIEDDDIKVTTSQELSLRCRIVNELVKQYPDTIYVSVHINASGADGNWHKGTGWEIYTSKGTTKSDILATHIYKAAEKILKNVRMRPDYSDGDPDKEANLYVLKHTICPAVLTENLFQDNKSDVDYLLSDEGFNQIVKLHVEGIINYIDN